MPFDGIAERHEPRPGRPKRIWYSLEYARQVRKRKVYLVEVARDGEMWPFLSIVASCKRDAAPVAHMAVTALHG